MKRVFLTTTAIFLGLAAHAQAMTFEERMVQNLEAEGYSDIEVEVKNGLMTIEGEKDGNEIETVYDIATEEVVSQDISPDDDDDDDDDDDHDDDHGEDDDEDDDDDGKDDT